MPKFLGDISPCSLSASSILGIIGLALCFAHGARANSITNLITGTGPTEPCVALPPNLIADPAFQDGCDTYQSDSEPGHWRFVFDAQLYNGGVSGLPCCAAEFYYLTDAGGSSAGSVDQEVDTALNQTYLIDFSLATNDVSDGAKITVEFGNTVGLAATNAELGIPADQFKQYSFLATATSTLTDFAVIGTGSTDTPNYLFYVTNVSVTAVTPEPSSFILFVAGAIFITIGVTRRRSWLVHHDDNSARRVKRARITPAADKTSNAVTPDSFAR